MLIQWCNSLLPCWQQSLAVVPMVSREKELSVFVSREEIRKGAQLVNSIAHYKVGLPFDASFLKRKIVKSEYMEIDLPESPKRGAAGREEGVL